MARILAVDWDRREVRYVLAATTAGRLKVLAASSAPMVYVTSGDDEPHPALGESLRAALGGRRVGRAVTLVGVDRASIELLDLNLPPATDAELPELVWLEAMRQSQLVTDDSLLDFVPGGDDPAEPRHVTAAALSPEQFERIKAACSVAGLRPQRMLLRPYASASLFSRATDGQRRTCLLVNLIADEADLIVLVDGRVVLLRTVRLPGGADDHSATHRLVAEINRTLRVALQTPSQSDSVEGVYIFGGPDEHEDLVERIGEELSLPVTVLDPFETIDVPQRLVPQRPGRFAALLGMALDEAGGGRHALDFLHPRRRPQPPNRRRLITIVAAAVTLAALLAGYFQWDTLATIDAQNSQLAGELKELGTLAKRADEQKKLVQAVRDWKAKDIIWLDELRDLSLRFPTSRDALVVRMSMAPARAGGGVIELQGLVRDPSIVVRMERGIRDRYREVRSNRVQQRGREKTYTWLFESSMSVTKRDKSKYVSHLVGARD